MTFEENVAVIIDSGSATNDAGEIDAALVPRPTLLFLQDRLPTTEPRQQLGQRLYLAAGTRLSFPRRFPYADPT